jgi:hypothetical protein
MNYEFYYDLGSRERMPRKHGFLAALLTRFQHRVYKSPRE